MKTRCLLLLGFLLISSAATAQDNSIAEPYAFSISSLDTPFAMQADFEGEYRIYPDRIDFRLTKTNVRISDHCPYKGRRVFANLKLGLVTTNDQGRWKIARWSQELSIEQVMSPGDQHGVGEVYFSIPIDDELDLSRHWLVAQMEDNTLDLPVEKRQQGYAFAHSCRDIFAQAMLARVDPARLRK